MPGRFLKNWNKIFFRLRLMKKMLNLMLKKCFHLFAVTVMVINIYIFIWNISIWNCATILWQVKKLFDFGWDTKSKKGLFIFNTSRGFSFVTCDQLGAAGGSKTWQDKLRFILSISQVSCLVSSLVSLTRSLLLILGHQAHHNKTFNLISVFIIFKKKKKPWHLFFFPICISYSCKNHFVSVLGVFVTSPLDNIPKYFFTENYTCSNIFASNNSLQKITCEKEKFNLFPAILEFSGTGIQIEIIRLCYLYIYYAGIYLGI